MAALQPELMDGSRNVRIAAAHALVATLDTNSPAGRDYLNYLNRGADQPLGQLAIGDFEKRPFFPPPALTMPSLTLYC